MFSHIVVGADDLSSAKRFYDATLGALGYEPGTETGTSVIYASDKGILMVTRPRDGRPASFGNGITIGFNAPTPDAVDAFHANGIAAGGSDEGAPGPREAIPNSYAAYVRDPTGNKLVAWSVKQS